MAKIFRRPRTQRHTHAFVLVRPHDCLFPRGSQCRPKLRPLAAGVHYGASGYRGGRRDASPAIRLPPVETTWPSIPRCLRSFAEARFRERAPEFRTAEHGGERASSSGDNA
ncbi:hypothetical protein HPB50_006367 [Hyalomma asiaticum]|uniref:Uncharacterized protein n=1 Tax=Hyalomma asiaticum TaxID=266040 RepID=A0ACB7RXN6_HYAAI|nr:hypothetical protein HPB50_006367 [Hyalomma asiaticum]